MNEGICGRFGRIGVKRLAYRPTRGVTARFPTDDVGVSFTTCGSRYFGNLAHDVETDLVPCDGG